MIEGARDRSIFMRWGEGAHVKNVGLKGGVGRENEGKGGGGGGEVRRKT